MIDKHELIKQLRIGNWLYGKDPLNHPRPYEKNYFRVEGIDEFENTINVWHVEGFSDESASEIEPIELTEDILLKCWFEKIEGKENIFELNRLRLWLGKGALCYLIEEDTRDGHYIPCDIINSLHQIQNLYYALTGKELQIDLS